MRLFRKATFALKHKPISRAIESQMTQQCQPPKRLASSASTDKKPCVPLQSIKTLSLPSASQFFPRRTLSRSLPGRRARGPPPDLVDGVGVQTLAAEGRNQRLLVADHQLRRRRRRARDALDRLGPVLSGVRVLRVRGGGRRLRRGGGRGAVGLFLLLEEGLHG